MPGESTILDSIFDKIMQVILSVLKFIVDIVFYNSFISVTFWLLVVNFLAIFFIKKDKEYAQDDKSRIKESTLLMLALAGGAVGMYYAMFKYKHKTLHKKFTILVPTFIVLHFALFTYLVVSGFCV